MKLTKAEISFIKNNSEMLGEIYRKKLTNMMNEVLEMEMGEKRQHYLEVVKLFKIELEQCEMIKSRREGGEKEVFI